MVLSSISPLFILWAIRGSSLIPDRYFITFCVAMFLAPNGFLWLRLRTARRLREKFDIEVGTTDDHRDHLLVYLFALLLPLYSEDLGSWRYLSSAVAALAFIVFLFWLLNLHYMNLLFAAFGYRVFSVEAPHGNPLSGKGRLAVITRRVNLSTGEHLAAYRLSDTVYMEISE